LVKNFNFPKNKESIKTNLISELIKFKDPKVLAFLKDLYTQSYSNLKIQTTILKALLNKKSYRDVLTLIQRDLPLEQYGVRSLFNTNKIFLELKKKLIPKAFRIF